MPSVVSFAELPVADQFESWQNSVMQTYVPLRATPHVRGGPFGGELVSESLGSTQISQISGGACEVARTADTIRQSDPGFLKLSLQVRGYCVLIQDGREAALTPGDFALYDTRRQYQLSFDSSFSALVMMFPHDIFPMRDEHLNSFIARRVSGRQGIGGLVAPLLLNMSRQMRTGELSAKVELSGAVTNLLAAAFSEQLGCQSRVAPETHRTALLLRVKAFIEARLGDPQLGSTAIAQAHHISPRYLQKLFEAEGTTVTDWVRRHRLEGCRSDLLNPRYAAISIGAIAARWGLVDSSYFSRLFKMTYGQAPREFRASGVRTASAESADRTVRQTALEPAI